MREILILSCDLAFHAGQHPPTASRCSISRDFAIEWVEATDLTNDCEARVELTDNLSEQNVIRSKVRSLQANGSRKEWVLHNGEAVGDLY